MSCLSNILSEFCTVHQSKSLFRAKITSTSVYGMALRQRLLTFFNTHLLGKFQEVIQVCSLNEVTVPTSTAHSGSTANPSLAISAKAVRHRRKSTPKERRRKHNTGI